VTLRAYFIAASIGTAVLTGVILARHFLVDVMICGYGGCP
jgi:hypothetical protein